MAEQIPGARRVELPGQDHFPWAGDTDAIVEEVRAFLTGTRVAEEPDRVLATVMFTDVVGSTERAASLGDRRWTELLDAHDARRPPRARGLPWSRDQDDRRRLPRDVRRTGARHPLRACDSFRRDRARHRRARRPAHRRDRASRRRHRRARGAHRPARLARPRSRRRSSCRAPSRISSPGPASSSRTGASTS